jgi:hypothetical protein
MHDEGESSANIDRTDLPVDATITVAIAVVVIFVFGCCLLEFSLPTVGSMVVRREGEVRTSSSWLVI